MFTLKLTLALLTLSATAAAVRWAYLEIKWVETLEAAVRDDPWPAITEVDGD